MDATIKMISFYKITRLPQSFIKGNPVPDVPFNTAPTFPYLLTVNQKTFVPNLKLTSFLINDFNPKTAATVIATGDFKKTNNK